MDSSQARVLGDTSILPAMGTTTLPAMGTTTLPAMGTTTLPAMGTTFPPALLRLGFTHKKLTVTLLGSNAPMLASLGVSMLS